MTAFDPTKAPAVTRSVEPPSGEVRGREIVERLREQARYWTGHETKLVWLLNEAAAFIEARSAERERMRAALRLADEHLTLLYPRGVQEGDYLCVTVRAALERGTGEGE